MARPRSIDQNAILDAAEAVVARDGITKLTLDSVAAEAGISKASVVYDYKSKDGLVRAVIERRMAQHQEALHAAIERRSGHPDAVILAHLDLAAEVPTEHSLAIGLNICAALAQDSEVRTAFEKMVDDELRQIRELSRNSRIALLAYLAINGFRTREVFGLPPWPAKDRKSVLADIESLCGLDFLPDR